MVIWGLEREEEGITKEHEKTSGGDGHVHDLDCGHYFTDA